LVEKLKYKNKKMAKIKNILIFTSIGVILVLIYVFFIKKEPDTATLVSFSPAPIITDTTSVDATNGVAQEFLTLLLSVTQIKLDDSIFSDPAFLSLHDSSIILVPDGNEGRPNPFAPIGVDVVIPSITSENTITNTNSNTPNTPASNPVPPVTPAKTPIKP
jgi:hypothetical protein